MSARIPSAPAKRDACTSSDASEAPLPREVDLEEVLPAEHDWPLRVRLAMVAAWEIEALVELLIHVQDEEFACEERAQRSVINRLGALAAVVTTALGDKLADPAELQHRHFPSQECDFACLGGAS